MKISNILRLIIVGFLFISQSTYAVDHIKRFRQNSIDIDLNSSFYTSQSNYYSNSGGIADLPYGGSYQLIDLEPTLRWMTSSRFAVYSLMNFSMAESHGYNAVDGAYKKTNTTLSRLGMGAEYLLYDGAIEIIPELRINYPLETYSLTDNSVMNQEGAMDLLGQFTFQMDWRSFKPFTSIGIDYRDQGRSMLMPWGLGAEYKFLKSALGGELSGFTTIGDDENASNNTNRRLQSLNVNGGSFRFGAVNPMAVNASVWFRFRLGALMAKTYLISTVAGGNYAAGNEVGILLRYMVDLNKKSNPHSPNEFNPQSMPDDHNEFFQEELKDGVDQKIFKLPTPVLAPNNYQMKKSTSSAQPNVDGEYQIKLKPQKKKKK